MDTPQSMCVHICLCAYMYQNSSTFQAWEGVHSCSPEPVMVALPAMVLAARTDGLGLIPSSHIVEGKNRFPHVVLWHLHILRHT